MIRVIDSPRHAPRSCPRTSPLQGRCIIGVIKHIDRHRRNTLGPGLPAKRIRVCTSSVRLLGTIHGPLPFRISATSSRSIERSLHLHCHCLSLQQRQVTRGLGIHRRIVGTVHHFLRSRRNFVRMRAPVLAQSAPRNTQSCLIPSQIGPKRFCTLPRSPRLFGRLLVMSNISHCCRITHYFHSRSLHTSHRPRFARLSVRVDFVARSRVLTLGRTLITRVFGAIRNVRVPHPFPHLACTRTVSHCNDSGPSAHCNLRLISISSLIGSYNFGMFSNTITSNNVIGILPVPNNGRRVSGIHVGPNNSVFGVTTRTKTGKLTCVQIQTRNTISAVNTVGSGLPTRGVRRLLDHAGTRRNSLLLFNTNPAAVIGTALSQIQRTITGRVGLVPRNGLGLL